MLARIYLGMHSLIDILGGLALGFGILAIWLCVSEYIDSFIVSGQNGRYLIPCLYLLQWRIIYFFDMV